MILSRRSILSGKVHTMELGITQSQLEAYERGPLMIDQAFPHLTADEREFIMTGITPEEWAKAFPDEETEVG